MVYYNTIIYGGFAPIRNTITRKWDEVTILRIRISGKDEETMCKSK